MENRILNHTIHVHSDNQALIKMFSKKHLQSTPLLSRIFQDMQHFTIKPQWLPRTDKRIQLEDNRGRIATMRRLLKTVRRNPQPLPSPIQRSPDWSNTDSDESSNNDIEPSIREIDISSDVLYISLETAHLRIPALFDTGASANFIKRSFILHHHPTMKILRASSPYRIHGSHQYQLRDYVLLPLKINQIEVGRHTFWLDEDSNQQDIFCYVLIWVDDSLVFYNCSTLAGDFEDVLRVTFEYTEDLQVEKIVGIEVKMSADSIILHQQGYNANKGAAYDQGPTSRILIPMNAEVTEGEDFVDNVPYRALIGSIMWAQTGTRPDLAYAISKYSRFLENHTADN